jgi:hypothetical protein
MSVRLPDDVYESARSITRRRGVSFNALIEESLRKEIAAEHDREMYEAATLLGSDPDSNVEYAFVAQSEVVLRDDGE